MNLLLGALKILSEYYSGRLSKGFGIDPPSLFEYLWKVNKHNSKRFRIDPPSLYITYESSFIAFK